MARESPARRGLDETVDGAEAHNKEAIMNWMKTMVDNLVENTKDTACTFKCSIKEAFEIVLKETTAGPMAIENAKKELEI